MFPLLFDNIIQNTIQEFNLPHVTSWKYFTFTSHKNVWHCSLTMLTQISNTNCHLQCNNNKLEVGCISDNTIWKIRSANNKKNERNDRKKLRNLKKWQIVFSYNSHQHIYETLSTCMAAVHKLQNPIGTAAFCRSRHVLFHLISL